MNHKKALYNKISCFLVFHGFLVRKIYLGELLFQKGAKFFIPYVLLHILLVAELEMECLLHSEGGNNKTLLIE